jgi:predicted Zn-dependent protease
MSPQYSQPHSPYRTPTHERRRQSSFSGLKLRLLIAGAIVLFTLVNYMMKGQPNPITGETQRVDMSIEEEIMLGLQSAPQMGLPSRNLQAQARVVRVGNEMVMALDKYLGDQGIEQPYRFDFHLLADSGQNRSSINAFALPGGQVFITEALYRRLDQNNDGPLAGVLGHEIGHVLERHSSERMTSGGLWQGLAQAAGVAGGSQGSHQAASMVAGLVHKKYGRDQELESDGWGVRLLVYGGYDPNHLLSVMDVLEDAAGAGGGPEFMSTHPRPANRKDYIRQIIGKYFGDGIPPGLQ